jgi:MoxR-like ATPase
MANERRMTADRFYGGVTDRLDNLRSMLVYISDNNPSKDQLAGWVIDNTKADSRDAIGHHLNFLNAIEIIDLEESNCTLGNYGELWLEDENPMTLYRALNSGVKGFDLVLENLNEGPMTDEEIMDLLVNEYEEANMTKSGPAVRHREWLQVLGFVDRRDDLNYITSDGEEILENIGGQSNSPPDRQPSVWIEKTRQEGRDYKQSGPLALGKALIAPSRDSAGRKRYETMREADVGDIVLHLLQEQDAIVGVSRIASELDEDFEGPPDDRWADEQSDRGGYLRELEDYAELDDPIDIYDDVLSNEKYADRLHEIRDNHDGKIIYNKRLALNQGHYFTQAPEELVSIFVAESEDLSENLAQFGVEITGPSSGLPEAVDVYDSIAGATDDITERLEITSSDNWLADEISRMVIEDWSEVLTNLGPEYTASASDELRLTQLRRLYANTESRLQEQAGELGSGSINQLDEGQTLFAAMLRDLQEQTGQRVNANHVKLNLIFNEKYDIEEDETEIVEEQGPITHPVLSHLDGLSESIPVRKFTAPPEYWLAAIQYGATSFEEREFWESIEPGEIALLHTRAETATSVENQPSGIFGVGILGEKSTKTEDWWTDDVKEEPFEFTASYDRLFLTCDLERIDLAADLDELSSDELAEQLDALTTGLLDFDEIESICDETNGISFPAQGAHAIFRGGNGNPDHERPRALIEAMANRLTEVGTINAHAEFDGSISNEPLDGLHYPGNQTEEIVQQIESALRSGKHIILTGPPGTGKTEIARRVCSHLSDEYPHLFSDFQLTTATADWSTFDTVGGYMPESDDEEKDDLAFTPGVVLNRFKERKTGRQVNEPIVIDELNRADIDKAFGQLFTLLSGQSVQLPYTRGDEEIELVSAKQIEHAPKPHQYVVPESWRIFATMNTYDKTSLYEMSYAFMRRFAFIRVPAPEIPEDLEARERLMTEYAEAWDISRQERERQELIDIGNVWFQMNRAVEDRAIGPAIVQDVLYYVQENRDGIPLEQRLTRAVISYILPQLEGVPKRERIVRSIASVDTIDRDELNDAAMEMLEVGIIDDE